MVYPMNRADAFALLNEYVKDPGLVRHMISVEIAMRAYARKLGADENTWGLVGLLHDFDYERWPDQENHPFRGVDILREKGCPEFVLKATIIVRPHRPLGQPRTGALGQPRAGVSPL